MATPVSGDFFVLDINGNDLATQIEGSTYTHELNDLQGLFGNTGLHTHAPGIFKPSVAANGIVKRGQGVASVQNLVASAAPGAAKDIEYIMALAIGTNAPPVPGDYGWVMSSTNLDYQRSNDLNAFQRFTLSSKPRGVRVPLFPVFLMDQQQANSFTTSPYDDGAESIGMTNGGVSVLEVLTPTGTAATGNVGIGSNAANGDTVVLNGVTFTAKTSPVNPGDFLIGANAAATLANLWSAVMASPEGKGTIYIAGVNAPTTVVYSVPTPTTLNITYGTTGTAGNSFTLVKTGTAFTVSAATLTGGVNGETATSAVAQTATTSGGSYTTRATHTLDFTKKATEIITIPIGTAIDEFVKLVITMSGSTMTWKARWWWGHWFPGQA
jgi:hypothetical protein